MIPENVYDLRSGKKRRLKLDETIVTMPITNAMGIRV